MFGWKHFVKLCLILLNDYGAALRERRKRGTPLCRTNTNTSGVLLYLAQHHTLRTTLYNATSHSCTRHFLFLCAHSEKLSCFLSLLPSTCCLLRALLGEYWDITRSLLTMSIKAIFTSIFHLFSKLMPCLLNPCAVWQSQPTCARVRSVQKPLGDCGRLAALARCLDEWTADKHRPRGHGTKRQCFLSHHAQGRFSTRHTRRKSVDFHPQELACILQSPWIQVTTLSQGYFLPFIFSTKTARHFGFLNWSCGCFLVPAPQCIKHFKEVRGCREVGEEVKRRIEDFRPYVPLIQALRNPGMRNRHWEKVGDSRCQWKWPLEKKTMEKVYRKSNYYLLQWPTRLLQSYAWRTELRIELRTLY